MNTDNMDKLKHEHGITDEHGYHKDQHQGDQSFLLYSMLLKRTGMSFKNNWIDKEEYISTLQSKKL